VWSEPEILGGRRERERVSAIRCSGRSSMLEYVRVCVFVCVCVGALMGSDDNRSCFNENYAHRQLFIGE